MTDQTALDNVLLGEGVKQMQEISREEILKQIFGDIGELADGMWNKLKLIFVMIIALTTRIFLQTSLVLWKVLFFSTEECTLQTDSFAFTRIYSGWRKRSAFLIRTSVASPRKTPQWLYQTPSPFQQVCKIYLYVCTSHTFEHPSLNS